MANGYEAGGIVTPKIYTPQGATRQEVSFFEKQSAKIAAEKKSQQQLRNQLIEQKLSMNKMVLGEMKPTGYSFDDRTNQAITQLVDKYVEIKNGMMKSEGEDGYVPSPLGMKALNQIQEQTNDIAFFNNQLSTDLLPHLRTMIGKDASLGYKDSKGAMSTAVPTDIQRLVMAVDNNADVLWEFTDDGQIELVMPGGEKDGVKYEEARFNLNEYGKYIEKGEEFFFDIPNIDDELNGAAEFVIGTPDQPKLDKNAKSYYTYETTQDGKINFSTIEMTEGNREKAITDLMAVKQFDNLLYSETRLNDRRALWQDCVTTPGQEGFGQNTEWTGSDEQLQILHYWLAETAVNQNLAPGTHVTGVSRRSGDPGGGSGSAAFTNTELKNIAQHKPQYDANVELVNEIFAKPKFKEIQNLQSYSISNLFEDQAGLEDLVKELNKFIDFTKFGGFKLASEMTQNERDQDVTDIAGEEVSVDNNTIVFIDANGKPKVIPLDFNDPEVMLNFLNQQTIGDKKIIYNLSTLYGGQDKKQTAEKVEITEGSDPLNILGEQ